MSEYSIGPFPPSTWFDVAPAHTFRRRRFGHTTTMGVYDDEDAVRADVDMEEEEEEIGQVRTMRRRRRRGFIVGPWKGRGMKMEIYTADDDPWMRSFHFIFIGVRRVLRACVRMGDGGSKGMEREMVVVRGGRAGGGTRRRWDGLETTFARSRSDRETDERKMTRFCTNVGGRVGRHQLLLRGEGFGATATRLV